MAAGSPGWARPRPRRAPRRSARAARGPAGTGECPAGRGWLQSRPRDGPYTGSNASDTVLASPSSFSTKVAATGLPIHSMLGLLRIDARMRALIFGAVFQFYDAGHVRVVAIVPVGDHRARPDEDGRERGDLPLLRHLDPVEEVVVAAWTNRARGQVRRAALGTARSHQLVFGQILVERSDGQRSRSGCSAIAQLLFSYTWTTQVEPVAPTLCGDRERDIAGSPAGRRPLRASA